MLATAEWVSASAASPIIRPARVRTAHGLTAGSVWAAVAVDDVLSTIALLATPPTLPVQQATGRWVFRCDLSRARRPHGYATVGPAEPRGPTRSVGGWCVARGELARARGKPPCSRQVQAAVGIGCAHARRGTTSRPLTRTGTTNEEAASPGRWRKLALERDVRWTFLASSLYLAANRLPLPRQTRKGATDLVPWLSGESGFRVAVCRSLGSGAGGAFRNAAS